MKRRSFLSCLLWMSWIPLVTVVAALVFQSLRIAGKKTEYYALGKIVAAIRGNPSPSNQADSWGGTSADAGFYQTQIEILESGALRARALERVRALHPDRKEIDVEIRVTQTKGSAILNVAAVGDEPIYTRLYLDALLDEYIGLRLEMRDRSVGSAMNKIIEQVVQSERKVKEARVALDEFERVNDPALISAEHERRVKAVSSMRGELEALKRSSPDEAKMRELMSRLAEEEKARAESWEKASKHLALQKSVEEETKVYDGWKKKVEDIQATVQPRESVAIMERPNAAVEQEPEIVGPLVIWGAMGLSVGVVLMLLAAMVITGLGGKTPDVQPPPLA